MELRLVSKNGRLVQLSLAGTVTTESTVAEDPLASLEVDDLYRRAIVLSMRDVSTLNSMGVGWLLRTHKLCQEAGGRMVLHSVPTLARNVLKMMRLDKILKIAADEEEAVRLAEEEMEP